MSSQVVVVVVVVAVVFVFSFSCNKYTNINAAISNRPLIQIGSWVLTACERILETASRRARIVEKNNK